MTTDLLPLVREAYEMSRYAAASKLKNTPEFLDGLFELVEAFQTKAREVFEAADAARNPSGGAPDEHGGNDDETDLVDGAGSEGTAADRVGGADCGGLPRESGVPNG